MDIIERFRIYWNQSPLGVSFMIGGIIVIVWSLIQLIWLIG